MTRIGIRIAAGALAGACAAACAVVSAACGGSGGPTIAPIPDQVVAVGDSLELAISASSDAGGELAYDYDSSAPDLGDRAQLTVRPDGAALFRWSPVAEDVGTWTFDFAAVDASGRATESVVIEVRSAIGSATLPVFRRPLGSGTAVKMAPEGGSCVTLELSATDQDSTEVVFAEEAPVIEGADLLQESEFEAEWHWCPSEIQRKAQDRYMLTLSADDGENPRAIKRYQIILRDAAKPACAGDAPVVVHAAADQATINPIYVEAEVSDESGLKAAPLLYYATTAPTDPRDVTAMIQLPMKLVSGDSRRGTWGVHVPSPLADGADDARLFYAIVAEDNDDSGGDCDHVVTEPFEMAVTRAGEDGELGLCEPCDSDAQCGGADDNCVLVGTTGEAFCFTGCDDAAGSCPDGYACSAAPVTSVDGVSARQCVPLDQSCGETGACPDDRFEQNDGKDQAQVLAVGATDELRVCPVGALAGDEDWYALEVAADAAVTVTIAGDTYPNLELSMLDAAGGLVAASEDWGSDDDVTRCLSAGTYYVRVYSYFAGENDYSIAVTSQPMECADLGGECTDDAFEDDDDAASARVPDFEDARFNTTGNQVCSGDDDYFFVHLFGDETIHGVLRFEQLTPDGDLDLLVYDGGGALLTQCTEEDASGCDADNGQSTSSNEILTFTAPDEDDYLIVVHGWAGSENAYDLCLALQPDVCTL